MVNPDLRRIGHLLIENLIKLGTYIKSELLMYISQGLFQQII